MRNAGMLCASQKIHWAVHETAGAASKLPTVRDADPKRAKKDERVAQTRRLAQAEWAKMSARSIQVLVDESSVVA